MSGKRETKTYQVWHDTGWPESRIAQLNGGSERHFPDDYAHVADVQANGLRQAVEMTTDKGGIVDGSPALATMGKERGRGSLGQSAAVAIFGPELELMVVASDGSMRRYPVPALYREHGVGC